MSDHVLSAAIDQDCAMFRAVQGREICHDAEPAGGEIAIAAATEMPVEADGGLAGSFGISAGADSPVLSALGEADSATLISPEDSFVKLDSTKGHPETARLVDFPDRSEVHALVQDDGALEIFVYRAGSAETGSPLSHIATYENYSDNPTALKGITIGGSFHAIGDLIV